MRLFVPVFLWASLAQAQVNVEEIRQDIEEDQIVSGIIEFGMDAREGNKQQMLAEGAGLLALSTGPNLVFFSASGEYEFSHGVEGKEYMLHLRDNFQIWKFVYSDVFGQYESDEFRKLRSRSLVGAGLRLDYDWTDWFATVYGTSYMPEHNVVEGHSEPLVFHRWNNFATILLKVSETTKIVTTTYFQPAFTDFENYRLYTTLAVKVKISDSLEAKAMGTYRYESRPPGEDVKSRDFRIKNALEYSF